MKPQPLNVICMKWGTRYGAVFANRLYRGVVQHLSAENRARLNFVCYTDDASGLDAGINAQPLPDFAFETAGLSAEQVRYYSQTPWRKLSLWQPQLSGIQTGEHALFLDLDLVITAPLDAFFTFAPEADYVVIENPSQRGRGVGNTSCFRFRVGAFPGIYDDFCAAPTGVHNAFRIEQTYISRTLPTQAFWPQAWVQSFKHDLLPPLPARYWRAATVPNGCSIVLFTGKPDPDEAMVGKWPAKWYKRFYKTTRPLKWVEAYWQA